MAWSKVDWRVSGLYEGQRRCAIGWKTGEHCSNRFPDMVNTLAIGRSFRRYLVLSDKLLEVERCWQDEPEPKLELIDGRLIVGNSLRGSRYLLGSLLRDLGAQAALAFAPLDAWWSALERTFEPSSRPSLSQGWRSWADALPYMPRIEPAGPRFDTAHYNVACQLMMDLHLAVNRGGLGRSIQRDFVMRLGENGFTSDLILISTDHLDRLHEYYLDGPADIVIEVVLPGHERQDTHLKRRAYAIGGVPEYWIVDPKTQTISFLRLVDGAYVPQSPDPEGRYRPAGFPELACVPDLLWACHDESQVQSPTLDSGVFEVQSQNATRAPQPRPTAAGLGIDLWLPFAPRVGPHPTSITFEEYIAWRPEAKFERIDDRPLIGGWAGTRNVLGLLMMTTGLEQAVGLLRPRDWVDGLLAEAETRRNDAARRDWWWSRARDMAELLRRETGVERVAVVGDLVRTRPLHYWSELTLVVSPMPDWSDPALRTLFTSDEDPRIDLINAEKPTPAEQRLMSTGKVEI